MMRIWDALDALAQSFSVPWDEKLSRKNSKTLRISKVIPGLEDHRKPSGHVKVSNLSKFRSKFNLVHPFILSISQFNFSHFLHRYRQHLFTLLRQCCCEARQIGRAHRGWRSTSTGGSVGSADAGPLGAAMRRVVRSLGHPLADDFHMSLEPKCQIVKPIHFSMPFFRVQSFWSMPFFGPTMPHVGLKFWNHMGFFPSFRTSSYHHIPYVMAVMACDGHDLGERSHMFAPKPRQLQIRGWQLGTTSCRAKPVCFSRWAEPESTPALIEILLNKQSLRVDHILSTHSISTCCTVSFGLVYTFLAFCWWTAPWHQTIIKPCSLLGRSTLQCKSSIRLS